MDKKFLRDAGHLYTGDSLMDGDGIRIARDLFQILSEKCYKNLAQYCRMLNHKEHLFEYSERQSPSYIMPALFAVTDGGAMCEMPLTRNKKNVSKNTGYLDYWAHYRGYAWAIEAKQSGYSLSGKGMAETLKKWEVAHEQLNQVEHEYITSEDEYIRFNLMLITFWSKDDDEDWQDGATFISNLHDEVLEGFSVKKSPNIWSYWKLPDEMVFIKGEKRDKYYPCIAMYGHIKLVEKGNNHHGN